MQEYTATTRKTNTGLQVDAHSHGTHYTIDEPKDSGGTNTGMNPVELELSVLGASLQETAKKLAKEKGFEYDKLTVNLEGDLDTRGFMGNPDIRNGFQEIRVTYQLKTAASQKESEQFMAAVEAQTLVMNTLKNGTKVTVNKIITK